jgi:hypothetical protein
MSAPRVAVTTSATRIAFCPDGSVLASCLRCEGGLTLHQPEPQEPHRFLGTCPDCRAWHYIDCSPDGKEATIVLIPAIEPIRKEVAQGGRRRA